MSRVSLEEAATTTENGSGLKRTRRTRSTCIRLYPCEECEVVCSTFSNYETHQRVHTGERPYKCDECPFAFKKSTALKYHKRLHTGEKPYKCQYCEYASNVQGSVSIHERIHTGDKPYKCDECDYETAQKTHLNTHKKAHGTEKAFKCEFCDYGCHEKGHLEIHRRIHTGEKPYKCGQCDYAAATSTAIKVHQAVHTGVKPYKCDQCSYATVTITSLNQHRLIHSGVKPFKCDECDHASRTHQLLKLHQRLHTGEKPYKCDKCDASYKQGTHLRKHRATKHNYQASSVSIPYWKKIAKSPGPTKPHVLTSTRIQSATQSVKSFQSFPNRNTFSAQLKLLKYKHEQQTKKVTVQNGPSNLPDTYIGKPCFVRLERLPDQTKRRSSVIVKKEQYISYTKPINKVCPLRVDVGNVKSEKNRAGKPKSRQFSRNTFCDLVFPPFPDIKINQVDDSMESAMRVFLAECNLDPSQMWSSTEDEMVLPTCSLLEYEVAIKSEV